jgi:hypothetical protein
LDACKRRFSNFQVVRHYRFNCDRVAWLS